MAPSVFFVGEPTPQSTVLRRYIDVAKFLDLLHTRTLYLARADTFSDRLEGALFPSLRRLLDETRNAGQPLYDADTFYFGARKGCFVSCRSLGARDNMALWQLYGGTKTSLAITTTVAQLLRLARSWPEEVELQRVKYVEHKSHRDWVIGSPRDVLGYKDRAYFYERELRLTVSRLVPDLHSNPPGIRLPVADLSETIRSVVLAPEATPDFLSSIKDLCAKYGLTAPVRQSKLAFVPT